MLLARAWVAQAGADKKERKSILDLAKLLDKRIRVKFHGGREIEGVLKGFDALLNLVVDEAQEYLRGERQPGRRGRLWRPALTGGAGRGARSEQTRRTRTTCWTRCACSG